MYNNYKLLRFLFETYGWTLILKNQSILFPKNVLRQVFCFFVFFFLVKKPTRSAQPFENLPVTCCAECS